MGVIRPIREADARAFLELSNALDAESDFRLLEPGERRTTVQEEQEIIRRVQESANDAILVAEVEGRLVGYVAALGGKHRRNQHVAVVVVSVLERCWGQGIGTQLLEALEVWARERTVHRLELTVMVHNDRAIGLYRKMGFEVEGRKRDALRVGDQYADEFCMAKRIGWVDGAG
jgi:RimJ/RimL family protein N-acetyltransferase